jgi:serine/threonine protein kinase
MLINKKYKVLEKIGKGTFGTIYKGENIRTKELVAIKIESINDDIKLIKNEAIIYQYLNNNNGIPSVKWFGKDTDNYYMIINLLGDSLQTVKNNLGNFSLKQTLQIGIKIIYLLKTIHDKGLIHRDIKPDNFLFSLNSENKDNPDIYIIDFGFCKPYIKNNIHILEKNTHNLIGSYIYASLNAHQFKELSRRDDLESVAYMLIYLNLGKLPWQHISFNNPNINEEISILKLNILKNTTIPQVLIKFIIYVHNLTFDEIPDYTYIIDLFQDII